jgi:membrane-bound serine protease (ClpP class)
MNAMRNLTLSLILGCFTAGAIILTFLVRLAIRSHRSGVETSTSRMIGSKGKTLTEVASEGRVSVQGEYWWAYSRAKIGEGETVRVIGIDGLTLEIEPPRQNRPTQASLGHRSTRCALKRRAGKSEQR